MLILRKLRSPRRAIAIIGVLVTTSDFAIANGTEDICEQSARRAATESGVPFAVLMAIGKTESGRSIDGRFIPWPWTINTLGTGQFFASQEALYRQAKKNVGKGTTSFDVGCFQINYRWHGHNFDSLQQMTDPLENARYAAHFLDDLHKEFGSWDAAAGAFHSRTEANADKYRKMFRRHLASETQGPSQTTHVVAQDAARENPFPLLKVNGGEIALGSLVPASLDQGNSALGSLVR